MEKKNREDALADQPRSVRAFISYSHEDRAAKKKFETRINSLRLTIGLSRSPAVWSDRKLLPGDPHTEKIAVAIDEAEVFFALLSPDYTASDYCNWELERASRRPDCRVVPVIVREMEGWEKELPIGYFIAIPDNGKGPTASVWRHEDSYWDRVRQGLRILFQDLLPEASARGWRNTSTCCGWSPNCTRMIPRGNCPP